MNEKQQIQDAFDRLKALCAETFSAADFEKVSTLLLHTLEEETLERGVFDLNPVLFDVQTAVICAEEIGLNRSSLLAILLKDVSVGQEDRVQMIRREFGDDVAHIIIGITRVNKLYARNTAIETENFRDLMLSFAEDMRVIFIIIADRVT